MEWQGTHLSYLGDFEYLDHLECLAGYYEGKGNQDTQRTQGSQHSHGRRLEHLSRITPEWRSVRQQES
jgi:hypothetical protein